MSNGSPAAVLTHRGPVLVEGGHFTLAARATGAGEPVDVPGLGRWWAGTTETTRLCLALAAAEVRGLRASGRDARLGLMVGDLALPAGRRPVGGAWALPESYRAILPEHGLAAGEIVVWGEAYCRNHGKRLLDEARHRHAIGRASYAAWGWALLHDAGGIHLASDASLDWDGDLRAAVLTRGISPLCPLVFAGLKRVIFQAGYTRHVAIYARADDPWIDVKLRSAAAAVAQLRLGVVGEQVDRILLSPGSTPAETCWIPSDLVAAGERDWPDFLAGVRTHLPGATELESPCPTTAPSSPLPCGATRARSPCSG
jgi:hypothetical protein